VPRDSNPVPAPRRGAVPPPPSEAPATVEVPRMEPPPPWLAALVQRTRRDARRAAPSRPRLLWGALLLVVAAGITAYVAK
jgi:hypothetical protein